MGLNAVPPLDACTYLAVDSGSAPIPFDLYSDILLALATDVSQENYLTRTSRDDIPTSPHSLLKV